MNYGATELHRIHPISPNNAQLLDSSNNAKKLKRKLKASCYFIALLILLTAFLCIAVIVLCVLLASNAKETRPRSASRYSDAERQVDSPSDGLWGEVGAAAALRYPDCASGLPLWPLPSPAGLGRYRKAAVATGNGACSEIGRNVLQGGGSAVDAAIAALVCICVVEPQSAGLGGGHFMTIFDSAGRRCSAVDAREAAPQAATQMMFAGNGSADSQTGYLSAGVPGTLAGLWAAYRKGGRLSWRTLLEPSVRLCRDGFVVSEDLSTAIANRRAELEAHESMRVFFNNATGAWFKAGETMRQPVLGKTLAALAEAADPAELFYRGSMAQDIANEFRTNGGLVSSVDLANYEALERQAVVGNLGGGLVICGPPPPSSAAVTAAIINVVRGFAPSAAELATSSGQQRLFHRMLEAMKFAYAQRGAMGDMSFGEGNFTLAQNMTTPEWAAWTRSRIGEAAKATEAYGGAFSRYDGGTAHVSVVDEDGNAVSATASVNFYFGSKRRSPTTGIIWNDEMDDFSTPGTVNGYGYAASPTNFIAPGKRPLSSMSPLVIFDRDSGEPRLVIGARGGSSIISATAYAALRRLLLGETLKEAIDAPRLHNQLIPELTKADPGFPYEYVAGLEGRGQIVNVEKTIGVVVAVAKRGESVTAYSDSKKGSNAYPAGY